MKKFLGNKGQSSVEYILLIAAIVAVMLPLFEKLQGYIIDNPDSMVKEYVSSFRKIFNGPGGGSNLKFKSFVIRR
jgi:hypothetical protein